MGGPWMLEECEIRYIHKYHTNHAYLYTRTHTHTHTHPTPPPTYTHIHDKYTLTCIVAVWGGPWMIDDCELRCRGGSSLDCSVFGGCWLRKSSLGGLSSHPMDMVTAVY